MHENKWIMSLILLLSDKYFILPGDWVILEYLDGQPYGSHCGSEPRRARVMFNCDSSVAIGVSTVKEWAWILQ